MQAETFLSTDLSIEKNADSPQILIYHTPLPGDLRGLSGKSGGGCDPSGRGAGGPLRERGYNVFHDESVYDYRDGKLDRSAAYTHALDGITDFTEISVHRSGFRYPQGRRCGWTRLVTELGGSETAKLMFFNGTSMSPIDGRDRISSESESQRKPGIQLPDAASGGWKISGTDEKDLFKRPPL